MNFKTKAMVAAMAFAAAGAANAAIDAGFGVDDALTGNGSLLLSLWNANEGVSALFDLGVTTDTFSAFSSNAWDLTSGDYADAWTAYSPYLSGSVFMVIAADVTGTSYETQHYMTTVANAGNLGTVTNGKISAFPSVAEFIVGSNAQGNHQSVENGANISGDALSYQGSKFDTNWAANGAIAVGALDTTLSFYDLVGVAAGGRGSAAIAVTATEIGAFNMSSNGILTAVPEPETYAMLLAGLGLVGAVARRRRQG